MASATVALAGDVVTKQIIGRARIGTPRDMAEEIAQQAKAKHFSSQAIVGLGDPAFAILEQAKIIKPDLIMVGSHGRRGLSRFLLGSVSHSLGHQATASVLVVRSSGSEEGCPLSLSATEKN